MFINKGIDGQYADPDFTIEPESEYLTIGDVAKFVLHNLWLVILSCIVSVGIGVYLLSEATEEFTASATILIDQDRTQFAAISGTTVTLPAAQVDDDLQVIFSDDVLRPVVERLGLVSDPEFASRESLRAKVKALVLGPAPVREFTAEEETIITLESLRRKLSVRRVGQSNVMVLYMRSVDPSKAAAITNAVSDSFIEQEVEAKAAAARRGSAWLQSRVDDVQTLATTSAEALADFKAENDLVDVGEGQFLNEEQLIQMNQQFMAARADVREAEARLSTLESALADGVPLEKLPEDPANPLVVDLRQQLIEQQASLRSLVARFGNEAVSSQAVQREIDALRVELREQVARSLEIQRGVYQAAVRTARNLETELDSMILDQRGLMGVRVRYEQLESKSRAFREMYETLLQQYLRSVQLESFPVSDARVVSRASVPLSKSHPRTSLGLLVAIILGVVVGLAIALLVQLFRTRVETPAKLSRVTNLPCVGAISRPRTTETADTEKQVSVFDKRNADYGMALREMWVALQQYGKSREGGSRKRATIIAFSGMDEGNGRDTMLLDLARIVASQSNRVLLVNTRPVSSEMNLVFGDKVEHVEGSGFRAAIMPVRAGEIVSLAPDVRFSSGEAAPFNPIVALSNLVEKVVRDYDVILADLPPAAETPEIRQVQSMIDALILIVRQGRTRTSDVLSTTANPRPGAPVFSGFALTNTSRRARWS